MVLDAEKGRLGGLWVQEGEAGAVLDAGRGRWGALDAEKERLEGSGCRKGRLGGRWVQGHRAPSTRSCLVLAQGRLLTGVLKNNFLSINVNKSLDLSSK